MSDTTTAAEQHKSAEEVLLGMRPYGWRTTAVSGTGLAISKRIGRAKVICTAWDHCCTSNSINMFVTTPMRPRRT